MRSPNGSYEDDFYYLSSRNWVNIIPITEAGEVIMIRQFRHGIQAQTLEVPGGVVDADDEPSLDAARRELEEETGYTSDQIEPLGFVSPNPAILNNRCYAFVALNARLKGEQNLDPAEDIGVELIPLSEIPKMILEEKIIHSLIICAFFKLLSREDLLPAKGR